MYVFEVVVADQRGDELLRLIGRRTVANRDERDMVCLDEFQEACRRRFALAVALRDLNYTACEDVTGRIDQCHLAARAVAGVKSEHRMPCKRGLQEKLTEVVPEYGNRLLLCRLGQLCAQFALKCGDEQPLVAVLD